MGLEVPVNVVEGLLVADVGKAAVEVEEATAEVEKRIFAYVERRILADEDVEAFGLDDDAEVATIDRQLPVEDEDKIIVPLLAISDLPSFAAANGALNIIMRRSELPEFAKVKVE